MDIFVQRRFWVAALPAVVMAANALGVPVTEGLLVETGDKVVAGVMGVLALWSYFFPRAE